MGKMFIAKENVGVRLDKFLTREFFSLSRGEIVKKIREGLVEINGKKAKPSYELKEGDALNVLFSFEPFEKKLLPNNALCLEILFENEHFLVLNKPAGLQVHPSHKEKQNTLANALVAYLPAIANVHDSSALAWMRPGIVHRLDKDTSGVMVVAKTLEAFEKLKHLFQKRLVTKKYFALVCGQLKEKNGVIEKEIARSADYRKQVIAGIKTKTKIRPAITEYEVIREYQDFSLVEARPKTGRMHQIRVHLASLGHPIAGDPVYGTKEKPFYPQNKPKRQLLHAQEITFELFGKNHSFLAPLPPDFEKFLKNLSA